MSAVLELKGVLALVSKVLQPAKSSLKGAWFMLKLLKPYYPDLELGTYTHTANSYHIYDRHFSLVDEMIENDFIEKSFPEVNVVSQSHVDVSNNW